MSRDLCQILDRAADLLEEGRGVALCVLVATKGSTPAAPGAVMLVDDAAETLGTIGGGCVEAEVRRRVSEMLAAGKTGLLHFNLNHDYGWDDGLLCGGRIEVAITLPADSKELRAVCEAHRRREAVHWPFTVETDAGPVQYRFDLPPRPRLYVAGAGHIGAALCRYALDLDFDVFAFDDRHDVMEKLIPARAHRVVGPIEERIVQYPIDDATYIVIVTRGHRHDERVLAAVVNSPARYLGMIGSRRKVKLTFDDLHAGGVGEEALARVRAPIGLDINAVTVNEIALSIAAQLVQTRRIDHEPPVHGPFPIQAQVA